LFRPGKIEPHLPGKPCQGLPLFLKDRDDSGPESFKHPRENLTFVNHERLFSEFRNDDGVTRKTFLFCKISWIELYGLVGHRAELYHTALHHSHPPVLSLQ